MSYKVGPVEHNLTQRSFDADRKACEAARRGNAQMSEYWRGAKDAYAEAARYAEKLGL